MPSSEFRIEFGDDQHIVGDHQPGDGPGYLFLHGLGSARCGDKSDSLMQHAERRGRACTRFDLRGHGDSSGTIGHVTISELIDDAERALEHAGRSVLVGSSLGGLVAAFAAIRHPQLVAAIALIAPAFGFVQRLEHSVDDQGHMWLSDGRSFPLAQRVRDDAATLDERTIPPALTMPTLIAHGDCDEIVPHARSERFFAAIGHDRKDLWIVEGGDHRLSNVSDAMWQRLDALLDQPDN